MHWTVRGANPIIGPALLPDEWRWEEFWEARIGQDQLTAHELSHT